MTGYDLKNTLEILQTSEVGDRLARKDNVAFNKGVADGTVVMVAPDILKQTINGIGSSFTEASAFVLAHLDTDARAEVMHNIYSEQGADSCLARTVIGSTDFSVEGHFSYDDVADDMKLAHFSIAADSDGFSRSQYPGIKDEQFDLLPMIEQALAIKAAQQDKSLRLIASAWTAPSWMKDIDCWHDPGTEDNSWQGTGGRLKAGYEQLYADYLIKYLDHYQQSGVDIWALTPVNEPVGNNGQWESMHFTAESQRAFIKQHLGPALRNAGHAAVKLLMFDHNRNDLEHWADVLYGDAQTAQYLYGAAVHWYSSTFKVYEDSFDKVHSQYPDHAIIQTEGCIDDLGKPAPPGVLDPDGYQESDWFDNDDFWWNDNATDWAYTATWENVNADDHPAYTPVHRYARDIIVGFNHWVSGWVDWNIVLDANGGPNHVGNFCGAPIMIDTDSGKVYYTPVFHVMSQLSRSIRPGDRAVQTDVDQGKEHADLYACATISKAGVLSVQVLNTTKTARDYALQIGESFAAIHIDANALQTIRVQL